MNDEKKNPRKVIFKCDQCGEEFTIKSFIFAVALHGIIFLIGKDDGYFGIVCPNSKCLKTTLQRREIKWLYSLKNDLLSMVGNLKGLNKLNLTYHSNPYSFYHGLEILDYCTASAFQEIFSLNENMRWFDIPDPLTDDPKYSKGYCSYFLGDIAMGPAMNVWWYKKDSIETLIKMENKTKLKVFPRYHFFDQFRSTIENFCWEHAFRVEYTKSYNEGDPFILIEEKMIDPHQEKIKKNYDFMCILNSVPSNHFIKSFPSSFVNFLEHPSNPEFHGLYKELGLGKNNYSLKDISNIQSMSANLWKCFTKNRIQNLLTQLSDRFISEYTQNSQAKIFSYRSTWNLKDRVLKEAYDSIKSEYKRQKTIKRITGQQRIDIEEMQERFPKFKKIITQDYTLNELKLRVARVAGVRQEGGSFLLLGESGTGKKLFAHAIHQASGRKGKFVVSDCGLKSEELFESQLFGHMKGSFTGAIRNKKGDFELADGGTIFLDEIGNLTRALQPKMLMVLDDQEFQPLGAEYMKKVNVNIVLATNKDLVKMVEDDLFINDLYQRFKRPQFLIPPLRERKGDIPLLVKYFIEKYDVKRKDEPELPSICVTNDCMDLLVKFKWNGSNVRELEEVIDEIMLDRAGFDSRKDITPSDLPAEILQRKNQNSSHVTTEERIEMSDDMEESNNQIKYLMNKYNNKSKVGRVLGVGYKKIHRRWKKLNA